MRAGGVVEVVAGTQSTGQGHETTFAQVLADQLGVTPEQVRLVTGDTAVVPAGGGTHSDRSMRLAGTLLVETSDRIVAQARAVFAALVGVQPERRRLRGRLLPRAAIQSPARHLRHRARDRERAGARARTARAAHQRGEFLGRIPAYPTGCAVCEVEVDPATGEVALTRYASVDDAGRAINPLILHGQVHGGIVQGAGQALIGDASRMTAPARC